MPMNQSVDSPQLRAVRSVIEADSIAEVVESRYAVGQIDSCLFLRRGFNDVYELQLADGERRIARLAALRARGEGNADFELSLLEHLKAEGVAVAAAHRTRDGALSTDVPAPEGVRSLAVFDYLDGKHLGDDLDDVRLTGAELARIHDGAKTYAGPESRYVLDIAHLLLRPLSRIKALRHLDDEVKGKLTEIATALEDRFSTTEASLSRVICHGDCHGGNTMIRIGGDGSRRAAFFDFDDSGPGYLAYDLSVFLWGNLLATHREEPDEKSRARWLAFIDGYRSIAPIPEADYRAVATFVPVRMMWLLGEYAGNAGAGAVGVQNLPNVWFRDIATLMEKWQGLTTPE